MSFTGNIQSGKTAQNLMNTSDLEQGTGEVCISNISPRERMKRLIGGVIPLVIALAILIVLILADVNRLWRLPLFFLFAGAASGFFQWRDKT